MSKTKNNEQKKIVIKFVELPLQKQNFYLIAACKLFLINCIKQIDCTFPISVD